MLINGKGRPTWLFGFTDLARTTYDYPVALYWLRTMIWAYKRIMQQFKAIKPNPIYIIHCYIFCRHIWPVIKDKFNSPKSTNNCPLYLFLHSVFTISRMNVRQTGNQSSTENQIWIKSTTQNRNHMKWGSQNSKDLTNNFSYVTLIMIKLLQFTIYINNHL